MADTVSAHHVGRLADGKAFDSSKALCLRSELSAGRKVVIKAWDLIPVGMPAVGVRRPDIVELIRIERGAAGCSGMRLDFSAQSAAGAVEVTIVERGST